MKKMKKLFAILMTMAMVMGLGITGFAATKNEATITVNNANGATLSYVQIIEPDRTTSTGWKFINNAGKYFTGAFGYTDEQVVIGMLTSGTVDSKKLADALSKVANSSDVVYGTMSNPQKVSKAGLYAIKAIKTDYTYNNMAAYVGFGEIKNEEGEIINEYPSLKDVELDAKGTPTTVKKTVTETGSDKVVQVGDIVTYTIETTVPYIDPNANSKKFYVYDDIGNGAKYYLEEEDSIATVTVGDETVANPNFDTSKETVNHDLVIDLSTYITSDNANAGKKVVVTYTAKIVKVDEITNTAGSHIGGSDSSSKPVVTLHTGEITITKVDLENSNTTLAGAEFTVKLKGTNTALKFDKAVNENGMNVYTYNPNGTEMILVTGSAGTLKVQGLDLGTYSFEETKAPEGYSKLTTPTEVELKLGEGEEVASDTVTVTQDISNTKLSALPETGGMGTTLFTIAGCVIMISAAGLFFATRKKAN